MNNSIFTRDGKAKLGMLCYKVSALQIESHKILKPGEGKKENKRKQGTDVTYREQLTNFVFVSFFFHF